MRSVSGQVDGASVTETIDVGSVPSRIKPNSK